MCNTEYGRFEALEYPRCRHSITVCLTLTPVSSRSFRLLRMRRHTANNEPGSIGSVPNMRETECFRPDTTVLARIFYYCYVVGNRHVLEKLDGLRLQLDALQYPILQQSERVCADYIFPNRRPEAIRPTHEILVPQRNVEISKGPAAVPKVILSGPAAPECRVRSSQL